MAISGTAQELLNDLKIQEAYFGKPQTTFLRFLLVVTSEGFYDAKKDVSNLPSSLYFKSISTIYVYAKNIQKQ